MNQLTWNPCNGIIPPPKSLSHVSETVIVSDGVRIGVGYYDYDSHGWIYQFMRDVIKYDKDYLETILFYAENINLPK